MKLCANLSLLFTEHPFLKRFEAAKNAGFSSVEIQFPYEFSIEDLVQAKNESNIKVVMINLPAGDLMSGGEGIAAVPSKQLEFNSSLKFGLKYAKALEVERVNILPGRCNYFENNEKYLATLIQNLKHAVAYLADAGFKISIEAINDQDMANSLIHNMRQMLDVYAAVDHPDFNLQFDIYHMTVMGENVEFMITNHLDKIGHIQFADMPGRGEPGTGKIDFHHLFSIITQSKYRGWIGAEYKPTCTTVDTLSWMQELL